MEHSQTSRSLWKRIGLIAGPLVALIVLWVLPETYRLDGQELPFQWAGRATLAMMVWMSIWWLTEAIHVTITSLLPLAMFPILQIATIEDTAAPYAHRLIFLYMGGFFLALAMQHWGLGKRIALHIIQFVGVQPYRIIAGFMITTAVFSAFVSNTATAVMMVAIAANLTPLAVSEDDKPHSNLMFSTCLMLAIAYSASIGGMATIIGTPPNTFLVGFLSESIAPEYRLELSFRQWLPYGVPVTLILLPAVYLVLMRMYPVGKKSLAGGQQLIRSELHRLGKMKKPEWIVLAVFSITVALWMCSKQLQSWQISWNGETINPFVNFKDEAVAMAASFLLFVIPAGKEAISGQANRPLVNQNADATNRGAERTSVERPTCQHFVLEWPIAKQLPWGILLLFGGGLTLASAVKQHSVAEFLASYTVGLNGIPAWLLVLGVTSAVVFLTELTSNAATTASLIPILAAIAPTMGVHPYLLIFPATFAASCAFMLPVATPPNAIVFGTGQISASQMARAGMVLNLVSIVVISVITWLWIRPMMGL